VSAAAGRYGHAMDSGDFYGHLAQSEPDVLVLRAPGDLSDARGCAYDLVTAGADVFTRVSDEADLVALLAAARGALKPSGRLAFHYPNPHAPGAASRLPAAERLDHLLAETGLVIHERYGDWDRSPFTATSPAIITVAASA
jgi:hypothetical protein